MINRNYQKWIKEGRKECKQYTMRVLNAGGWCRNTNINPFAVLHRICDIYRELAIKEFGVIKGIEFNNHLWETCYDSNSAILVDYPCTNNDSDLLNHWRLEKTEEIIKAEIGI